jgi:hypothetical protein
MRIVYELHCAPYAPEKKMPSEVPAWVRERFMSDFALCPPTVRELHLRIASRIGCEFARPACDHWTGRIEEGFDE